VEIKQFSDVDPERANAEYAKLMNEVYGSELKASDNVFISKHIDNPFGRSFGAWIHEGERLVPMNFYWPWEFVASGGVIKAAQSLDTLVHPDFRGKGLFKKVQQACQEAMPRDLVRFGFPNEQSKPGFLKWGWRQSNRYVTRIYPISWIKFGHQRL